MNICMRRFKCKTLLLQQTSLLIIVNVNTGFKFLVASSNFKIHTHPFTGRSMA